jgi:hypothetical protein
LENEIEHAIIIAKHEKIMTRDLPQYLLQHPLPAQQLISPDHERILCENAGGDELNKHQTAKGLNYALPRSTVNEVGLIRA